MQMTNRKQQRKPLVTVSVYELIDQTACMLRGMTMDPSTPLHAKEAMQSRIHQLEEALENLEAKL